MSTVVYISALRVKLGRDNIILVLIQYTENYKSDANIYDVGTADTTFNPYAAEMCLKFIWSCNC